MSQIWDATQHFSALSDCRIPAKIVPENKKQANRDDWFGDVDDFLLRSAVLWRYTQHNREYALSWLAGLLRKEQNYFIELRSPPSREPFRPSSFPSWAAATTCGRSGR